MPEELTVEWITTQEAADLTGYNIQYIRRLAQKGRIPSRKWVRDWMVDKLALLAYQQKMQQLGGAKYDPWRTGARERKTDESQ